MVQRHVTFSRMRLSATNQEMGVPIRIALAVFCLALVPASGGCVFHSAFELQGCHPPKHVRCYYGYQPTHWNDGDAWCVGRGNCSNSCISQDGLDTHMGSKIVGHLDVSVSQSVASDQLNSVPDLGVEESFPEEVEIDGSFEQLILSNSP
ncbi:hypothetical protein Pan14r_28470 [Crateriforma conspicua]|uniref:Uncharacterized protein n=2 Tax=Crateriforma conspicua TaxID=2527996 RepID=A0A5C5Y5P8_9PLAN|nr:hypothetical protein Mal65_43160 [Crateriforma conspicua]TWT70540.1 hypothetical protein Pan14r_28470 [Crateriforma conspicua]